MKLQCVAILVLFFAISVFANRPSKEQETQIESYLSALADSNRMVQHEALKKLNAIKNQYPDYKIKGFDDFMKSDMMKKTTQQWIQSLSHESDWIRHSTLQALVMLKSDFPNLDMSVFNKSVQNIVNNDPQKHLQVDAKIAYIYLNDPELAKNVKIDLQSAMDGDIFTQIHLEMDKLFTSVYKPN